MGTTTSTLSETELKIFIEEEIKKQLQEKTKKELEKKLQEVQEAYNQLKKEHQEQKHQTLQKALETIESGVSKDAIHVYVQELIQKENLHVDYVPKRLESAIYDTIFYVLLSLLNKTVNSNTLSLFGHKVRVILEPEIQADTQKELSTEEKKEEKEELAYLENLENEMQQHEQQEQQEEN